MKDIKKPEFMKAAMTARSHHAVLELLIALLVFFVGDILISVLQVPIMIVYLLGNREYMSMILSNSIDFEKIMEIMMNVPDWFMIMNLLMEAAIIVVFILYCRLFEKRKAATMGFRKQGLVKEYLKGILIGIAAFVAAYGICFITGSVNFSAVAAKGTTGLYLLGFLLGYLVQGMAEEVICRGYLLVSLSRRYTVAASVVISAIFFSMLHGLNAGVGILAFINLFLFGAFMGLLFIRCENIWVVGAVHSVWNFLQGNVFGIQVSGMSLQPSLFTTDIVKGKEIINGGSFGAEGGLAVTIVLLLATGLLLRSMSKHGYFVEAEPVVNPYDKPAYGVHPNQAPNGQGYQETVWNQQTEAKGNGLQNPSGEADQPSAPETPSGAVYENMGFSQGETPWTPQQEKRETEEKTMTEFDQNYFKD